ncbi:MAG: hypothetical protein WD294_02485 [Phycisphaeraceae bacterium]
MFEILLILTAVVIVSGMWLGYRRMRDPFVPAVVFAPMLAYMYVYSPAMLQWGGHLDRFFEPDTLAFVQMVNLAFVAIFCVGLLPRISQEMTEKGSVGLSSTEAFVDPATQQVLFRMASVIGWLSLLVFIWLVIRAGGPVHVFSQAKVYIGHPIGYVSELPMLAYPAILLLAVSLQGRRVGIEHIILALLFALPHLSVGLIGNRRGPTFLILLTLMVAWYVARQKRPTLRTAVSGVVILGMIMLLLVVNRQVERAGGDAEVDSTRVMSQLTFEGAQSGQEYIYAGGLILTASGTGEYYWGRRWFMQFVLRPFPSALWPSMYDDLGFGDMVRDPGHAGFTEAQWEESAGFLPPRGTAGGIAADLFREWGWLGLVSAFLIGKFYSSLWRKFATVGGLWTIMYMIALALSVYLVSQSVGAWLYRVMMILIPTWLAWRYFVAPRMTRAMPDEAAPLPIDEQPQQLHGWLAGPPVSRPYIADEAERAQQARHENPSAAERW